MPVCSRRLTPQSARSIDTRGLLAYIRHGEHNILRFKNAYLQDELAAAHESLRSLVAWADGFADDRFAKDLLVTSVARTPEEQRRLYAGVPVAEIPKSPHCTKPCRAADISVRNLTGPETDTLERSINGAWTYDARRPGMRCALVHKAGLSGALHLHLQVHDHTHFHGGGNDA